MRRDHQSSNMLRGAYEKISITLEPCGLVTTYIKIAPQMTICDDKNFDIGNRCNAKFAGYLLIV